MKGLSIFIIKEIRYKRFISSPYKYKTCDLDLILLSEISHYHLLVYMKL